MKLPFFFYRSSAKSYPNKSHWQLNKITSLGSAEMVVTMGLYFYTGSETAWVFRDWTQKWDAEAEKVNIGVPRPSLPHTSLPCSLSSSVQFSHSVVFDSLRPHESQHARLPCPSPTQGVYSNSCPSGRWRHPDILSSVIPFSSWPQSLPASGSFPMSQLFLLSPSSFLTTCYKLICDVHLWQAPPLNQNEFFIRAGWSVFSWLSLPDIGHYLVHSRCVINRCPVNNKWLIHALIWNIKAKMSLCYRTLMPESDVQFLGVLKVALGNSG